MNLEPKLQSLEASLKTMRPAESSERLLNELEAVLAKAEEERVTESSKIIPMPIAGWARWSVAAAAMFAALLMAVSSTRVSTAPGGGVAEETLPMYRVEDGRLIPDKPSHTTMPVGDSRTEDIPIKLPPVGERPNNPGP